MCVVFRFYGSLNVGKASLDLARRRPVKGSVQSAPSWFSV